MNLGPLNLLSPLWLWGLLAAVGVPLAAHLLSRRGGRLTLFPATHFVQRAVAESARIDRPRDRLLLLLRCLILSAVVLAFTRPVWQMSIAGLSAGRGLAVAILLDRSFSMQRTEAGASLFDEAVRRADRALAQLDPITDRAAVITIDASPTTLLPEPTARFHVLRDRLGTLAVTFERGDLAGALELARQALATMTGTDTDAPHRKPVILLITDAQATQMPDNWPESIARRRVELRLERLGAAASNAALFEPRATPAEPVVGQQAQLAVHVGNFSQRRRTLSVQIQFDDHTARQAVMVEPFGVSEAVFRVTPRHAGLHEVVWSLVDQDDALPQDDRVGLVVPVRQARRVLLVSEDVAAAGPGTADYFLRRALQPQPDDAGIALQLSYWSGLARADVAVIADGPLPDDADLARLRSWVNQGGKLVWFVTSRTSAQALRRLSDTDADRAFSPIVPDAGDPWREDEANGIGQGQFQHPVLRPFEGPARSELLAQQFTRTLRGVTPPTATPLLTFDDGRPLLALHSYGAGQVAVFGGDLSPDHGDFVRSVSFVPLLHSLIRVMDPGREPPSPAIVGHPLQLSSREDAAGRMVVRDPQGQPIAATLTTREGGGLIATVARPARPGVYQLAEDGVATPHEARWVRIDPAESDLRQSRPPWPDDVFAGARAEVPVTVNGESSIALRVSPIELWPWLLWTAAILAAIEAASGLIRLPRLWGSSSRRRPEAASASPL